MAIFKRRKPRGTAKKIKETLWPAMGWGRTANYYRHRLFRTGDSTYRIAAGLAAGVAVSWSPFYGTHFIQALFFAWLLRANLLAGFLGTAWGNPWTFPFMLWTSYIVGIWICGLFGLSGFVALPAHLDAGYFTDEPWEFIRFMVSSPLKLFLPLTVGGYLCGLLIWPVAYLLLYYPVHFSRLAYIKQRRRIRRRKAAKGRVV